MNITLNISIWTLLFKGHLHSQNTKFGPGSYMYFHNLYICYLYGRDTASIQEEGTLFLGTKPRFTSTFIPGTQGHSKCDWLQQKVEKSKCTLNNDDSFHTKNYLTWTTCNVLHLWELNTQYGKEKFITIEITYTFQKFSLILVSPDNGK